MFNKSGFLRFLENFEVLKNERIVTNILIYLCNKIPFHSFTPKQTFDSIRISRYNKNLKKIIHIEDVKNIYFA